MEGFEKKASPQAEMCAHRTPKMGVLLSVLSSVLSKNLLELHRDIGTFSSETSLERFRPLFVDSLNDSAHCSWDSGTLEGWIIALEVVKGATIGGLYTVNTQSIPGIVNQYLMI